MSSFSSGMNPSVVKTALDSICYTEYDKKMKPEIASASDSLIFNQLSTSKAAEIEEVFKGVGFFDSRQEEEDVASDTPRVGNQKTFSVVNYAKSVDITKNLFDRPNGFSLCAA